MGAVAKLQALFHPPASNLYIVSDAAKIIGQLKIFKKWLLSFRKTSQCFFNRVARSLSHSFNCFCPMQVLVRAVSTIPNPGRLPLFEVSPAAEHAPSIARPWAPSPNEISSEIGRFSTIFCISQMVGSKPEGELPTLYTISERILFSTS